MTRMGRLDSALRALLRQLVPCQRRRRHLVLVLAEEHRGESGVTLHHYRMVAMVRPEDREALRPLVQQMAGLQPMDPAAQLRVPRLPAAVAYLRLCAAEDGAVDLSLLWHQGERVDDLRDAP